MICPDCCADVDERNPLRHEPTCPLALAMDADSAADAVWFAAHPFATEYRRPPTLTESAQLLLMMGIERPEGAEVRGRVLVRRLAPYIRTRDYSRIYLVLPPFQTTTLNP
jgi:hypothetical protein